MFWKVMTLLAVLAAVLYTLSGNDTKTITSLVAAILWVLLDKIN